MSDRGAFVVIVGPDGSGKTTLAHAIADRVGNGAAYFHFLPQPLWRLSERPGPPGALVDKYAGHGSRLLGCVRLVRSVVKARLAYWMAVGPALRQGKTVVGDRYLYGYLVQPTPLKFFGPSWFARAMLRLIPEPDLVVVLDAPTDVIRARKPELSETAIDLEREGWRYVARRRVVLNSAKAPSKLVDEIVGMLKLPGRLYPPGLGHVMIPDRPRNYALFGTSLYGPSRGLAIGLHRVARLAVAGVGTRWLKTSETSAPLASALWAELVGALVERGISVERVALYRRVQEARTGFSFMAFAEGSPTAFVRVNTGSIAAEIDALGRVATEGASAFHYPVLLTEGQAGDARFAAFTPVLSAFHRPDPKAPLALILNDVQRCLHDLPKLADVPDHWLPMHGDFTPWNLRRERNRLVLIDWERADWGPPGADATLYWAAALALGFRVSRDEVNREAARFWEGKLEIAETPREQRLTAGLLRALETVDR